MKLDEKQNWTALLSINGVGKKTFTHCLKILEKSQYSWDEFWVNKDNIWELCLLNEKQKSSINSFKKAYSICSFWDKICSQNVSVISCQEEEYPKLLGLLEDKPPILFVKGDCSWGKLPIAIVGTRRMTSYGRLVTEKISRELIELGASIISGFMYGVDVCAQKTALSQGGKTVGVLGYGFDYVYPVSQSGLMKEMLEKGATFITEYPPYVFPTVGNFPTRNRLIAGMSLAVVVTEAAEKSGSHITANFALDYGRNVLAVPGPITNLYSLGTKQLINQGASLITSGQDIIGLLKGDWQVVNSQSLSSIFTERKLTDIEKQIIDELSSQELTVDNLAKKMKLTIATLNATLNLLEIEGLVEKVGEGWILKK